jgi:hypothetical protein
MDFVLKLLTFKSLSLFFVISVLCSVIFMQNKQIEYMKEQSKRLDLPSESELPLMTECRDGVCEIDNKDWSVSFTLWTDVGILEHSNGVFSLNGELVSSLKGQAFAMQALNLRYKDAHTSGLDGE